MSNAKDRKRAASSNTVIETACDYLQLGWMPMRLPPRSKEPASETHDAATITRDNVKTLAANENLGVRFTTRGALKDIDLDYQSAVDLARAVGMTEATAVFGRPSVGIGHLLYNAPGTKAKKFMLPEGEYPTPVPMHDGKRSLMVLEIRGSDNTYTMFPPSVHPSGETLEWNGTRRTPADVDEKTLRQICGQHAFASVVLYFYPENAATRYEVRLALAGTLLRAGMPPERAERYARAIARLGGDEKWEEDFIDNAEKRIEQDKPAPGLPKLIEALRLPKDCEAVFREWLQIEGGEDPHVAELNRNYALVLIGDKAVVLNTSAVEGIKLLTVQAFKQWLANRYVSYQNKKGDEQRTPLAQYWLQHRQRRQYEGVVFAPQREVPGHYNLWRGFAVEPLPGDCSKFLAHLKDNVCQGNEGLYCWTVGWFAQIVQDPAIKSGTSLVLRGKQGTGKTKVGEVFGSIIGEHYALVSDPRYVTGRFNSHLVSCLLLHCDEAFWAGDKAAEGKLKDLITGYHQFIEFKGKEAIRISNYVRLLVTGNADWQVPAGFGERRFAVLDVGEAQMQNHAYFAAIDEQMKNGGHEALLHHLLNFDLSTVNLREIPKTAALVDQKLSSLDPEQGWWIDMLMRGELPGGCDEPDQCPAPRLVDSYIKHAQQMGRRRSIETKLGIFLRKMVPGLKRVKGSYDIPRRRLGEEEGGGKPGYIYILPSLVECRAEFAKALQQDIPWPDEDEWTTAPSWDI